jgi:predicted dehydrogenase
VRSDQDFPVELRAAGHFHDTGVLRGDPGATVDPLITDIERPLREGGEREEKRGERQGTHDSDRRTPGPLPLQTRGGYDAGMTRREVFRAAAPLIVPASAFGANDRIQFGLIATGNRGRGLLGSFQKAGAKCVALSDVYEPHLETARGMVTNECTMQRDYRNLLAQKDVDAVVIASPDHHHKPMLLAALAAKKDVYLEKPLSMSLADSEEMVRAVRATDRVVQIGMQRRSMQFIRNAKKLVDDGTLGKVTMVKALWNWHFELPLSNAPLEGKIDWEGFLGPAPKRPLEPRRYRWWRGFWDYSGGNMTDQGTHLMDVVQWMTGTGAPIRAVCNGRVEAVDCEVPNVFTAVFEYPSFLATWTLNYRTTHENDWSITFQGEKATMVMDRRGYRVYADGGLSKEPWSYRGEPKLTGELPDTDRPEAHQANFLECVKSRKAPNCPIEVAAAAVAGPHMANRAWRQLHG